MHLIHVLSLPGLPDPHAQRAQLLFQPLDRNLHLLLTPLQLFELLARPPHLLLGFSCDLPLHLDLPLLDCRRPLAAPLHVLLPAPFEKVQVAVFHHPDVRGQRLNQIPVVADQQQRPGEPLQHLLKDLLRGDIQVVGRLVEHQEIGVLHGQPRQRHPAALPPAQLADRLEHIVALEQETPQQGATLHRRHLRLHLEQRVQHPHLRVQIIVRLRQVPDLHAGAYPHPACQRFQLAQDRPHQRGLARAVGTDHRDPHTAPRLHLGQLQNRLSRRVSNGQLPQLEDDIPAPLDRVQAHPDVLRLLRFVDRLVAHEARQPRAPSLGLASPLPGDVPLDEVLGLGDVLLLLRPLPEPLLIAHFALVHVRAVVAPIDLQRLERHIPGAVGHRVQEIAIVRHRHQAALKPLQPVLQPFYRLQVQVIGRLVQKQQIRLLEQQPPQQRPGPLTAAQLGQRMVEMPLVEPQPGQHRADPPLVRVPVLVLELGLQGAVLAQQFLALAVSLQAPGQLLQICLHAPQTGEDLQHRLPQRHLAQGRGVLGQKPDAQVPLAAYLAVGGLFQPDDQTQQRGLAFAVGPHQTDAVHVLDAERNVFEDVVSPVVLVDTLSDD